MNLRIAFPSFVKNPLKASEAETCSRSSTLRGHFGAGAPSAGYLRPVDGQHRVERDGMRRHALAPESRRRLERDDSHLIIRDVREVECRRTIGGNIHGPWFDLFR